MIPQQVEKGKLVHFQSQKSGLVSGMALATGVNKRAASAVPLTNNLELTL